MPKFVPRERKHKRLARQNERQNGVQTNANAEVIVPISKSEKEDRRKALQDELRAQRGNEQVTGKKRKRLDKYIDNKLKKEENLDLLKKLAAHKVDTSLLQSSKKLGRVNESKRERFQRALKERQAGVDVNEDHDTILFEQRRAVPDLSDKDDEDDETSLSDLPLQSVANPEQPQAILLGSLFGSGLKQPLETDEAGRPIIKKRKRRKQVDTRPSAPSVEVNGSETKYQESEKLGMDSSNDSEDSDAEWKGFDSDDSPSQSVDEDSESDEQLSSASSQSDGEDDGHADQPARVSAFKAWADSQRNEAIGFTPSTVPTQDAAIHANFKPRQPSPDPDSSAHLTTAGSQPSTKAYRPSHVVTVPRDAAIESARLELPVVQEEQKIMEAITNNSVVVVCGATGSGKTTQVPQMLLENGYASNGIIGITQPRRVAATSVAARVSAELGTEFGKKVSHQVRYDSNVGRDTAIKFMTDGILLREISQDFALHKYSAIVVDEAHERSVNTDILIGMLSRIVPLRHELSQEQPDKYVPLKLVIMSATLRVTDFIMNDRLFRKAKPPIVEAEGRQYPVTVHFGRRTQRDFVAETIAKVSRGHKKLPPGGMLVFLTGQDEIQTVAKRLKEKLSETALGLQSSWAKARSPGIKRRRDYVEDDGRGDSDSEAEIKIYDDDSENDDDESDYDDEFKVEDDATSGVPKGSLSPYILPLYAALPSDQQMRVFDPPPAGSRLIVLSTNVAETSLTIPGIRYVFDCGRSKEKRYDELTGVQEFAIDWISKASASQRTGRAGRTGPGHCYRLYSSAIYEQYFEEYTIPEILRTPIEGTVLQLKTMNVENVVNFPFPTPPKAEQLAQAERLLKNLGAIDPVQGRVADLGKELIKYPVNPRFGKMLMLGLRNKVLDHTVALVAGLAVGDLFVGEPQLPSSAEDVDSVDSDADSSDVERQSDDRRADESIAAQQRRQAYGRAHAKLSSRDDQSDVIKMLTAVAAHAQAVSDKNTRSFCSEYFLREKGMSEVQQLRRQLHALAHGQGSEPFSGILRLATTQNVKLLKQIVAAGFIDQVAIRADLLPAQGDVPLGRKPRRAIEVPYRSLMLSNHGVDRTASIEEQGRQRNVYVHSGSVLARLSVKEMPSYIIYSHLSRAAATVVGASQQSKTRMHPLTTVGPKQLAALAEGTPLLEIGKPIGKIEELAPGRRECWVGVALRDPAAAGSTAWPLGAWKVIQTRSKKDWTVDKVLSR